MPGDNRGLAKRIAAIAKPIWNECYAGILSIEQIDYMVKKFQSEDAIYDDLENGYVYDVVTCDDKDVGYCGYAIDGDSVYLSKFYIMKDYRKRGLGRKQLERVERYADENGRKRIHLRVNRHNANSIAAYMAWGFVKFDEDAADIGGGFVMDDYCMEKIVG